MRRSTRHRLAVLAGAGVALLPVVGGAGPAAGADGVTVLCRITDDRLTEISGMAPSARYPGILWLHNDSGDAARLYAVDSSTCTVRATLRLRGVDARDVEAIAAGVDPRGRAVLWVGDIGDNNDSWRRVRVYAVPEPATLRSTSVPVVPYSFTYADGPVNAETLLADPASARLWVVSKQLAAADVWALPYPLRRNVTMTATKVGGEGGLVTDGAVSSDGSRYVVRDYVGARVYDGLPVGRVVADLNLPVQPQGEAVAWAADGRALLLASERDDRLLRMELPREAWTATALAAAPTGTATAPTGTATAPTGTPTAPTGTVAPSTGAANASQSQSVTGTRSTAAGASSTAATGGSPGGGATRVSPALVGVAGLLAVTALALLVVAGRRFRK